MLQMGAQMGGGADLFEQMMPTDEELKEMFDEIDENHDERVSLDELKKGLSTNQQFLAMAVPQRGAKELVKEMRAEMAGGDGMPDDGDCAEAQGGKGKGGGKGDCAEAQGGKGGGKGDCTEAQGGKGGG